MNESGIHIRNGNRRRTRRFKDRFSLALLALTLTFTGCATSPATSSRPRSGTIIAVNLLTMPVALNLDTRPGADGVQLRVFLMTRKQTKTVPMTTGSLEIVAYDGTLNPDHPSPPFHGWRFDPNTVASYAAGSAIGTGYNLILSWAPKILTQKRVTIVARFIPAKGPPVVSAPCSIAATSM